MTRRIGWLALAAVCAIALVVGVVDRDRTQSKADRAQDVAGQLMCPNCKGQSVADSASSASNGIRQYINTRIDQGASNDEIVDELRIRYGDDIVLTPGKSGIASLVWTLPVAALVAAVVALAFAFRRWRHRTVVHASEADRVLVDQARGG